MHLVFGATGIKQDMDLFEKFMETRTFLLPYIDHNDGDKEKQILLQSQLRPINFYDFIFPKGELNHVLNGLQPESEIKSKNCVLPNAYISILRKALKLKKIPAPDISQGAMPIGKQNIRVVGIGIREDADVTFKEVGRTHEGI